MRKKGLGAVVSLLVTTASAVSQAVGVADRVGLQESANIRVIVSGSIVIQAGFIIITPTCKEVGVIYVTDSVRPAKDIVLVAFYDNTINI